MSQLRTILFKNWIPKLTCLLIAIGLWFWVSIQQTGRAQFEVPIEYVNAPPNLVVAESSPRNLTVSLQGPKKTLFSTDSSNIHARINLSEYEAGTKIFWRSEIKLEKPKNLRVYSVIPRRIEVRLAKRSEKTLDVKPVVESKPPEGIEYELSVRPETGTVYGPDETIQSLQTLRLESLDLSGRRPDTYSFVKQARIPREAQLSYPSENAFEIQAQLHQKKITRTIEGIPVKVVNVPAGMDAVVEPGSISLDVRGPKRAVENLSADDIDVKVEAPDKDSGQSIRVAGDAEISLPDGIKRVNEDGEITALRVQLEPL